MYFNDFVLKIGLFDLGFLSPSFTWCNNQQGLSRWWAILDRFLGNNAWTSNFDSYFNQHLPRISSDYTPILLTANYHVSWNHRIFLFENFWMDYHACHDSNFKVWNSNPSSSPMHVVSHFISRAKSHLLDWRSKGKNALEMGIQKMEGDIEFL